MRSKWEFSRAGTRKYGRHLAYPTLGSIIFLILTTSFKRTKITWLRPISIKSVSLFSESSTVLSVILNLSHNCLILIWIAIRTNQTLRLFLILRLVHLLLKRMRCWLKRRESRSIRLFKIVRDLSVLLQIGNIERNILERSRLFKICWTLEVRTKRRYLLSSRSSKILSFICPNSIFAKSLRDTTECRAKETELQVSHLSQGLLKVWVLIWSRNCSV